MKASLSAIKLPAPDQHGKISGAGAFPQGTYLPNVGFGAGSWAPGSLGKEFDIQQDDILKFRAALLASLGGANSTTGATLKTFGQCTVQIVQTIAGSIQAPTAGQLAYWSDRTGFVVTPDPDANNAKVAGVYLYTPNKGDYVYMVTFGEVDVKCKAVLTNASVAGQLAFAVTDASLGAVDGQAAATAMTMGLAATVIGRCIDTLVGGAVKRIFFNPNFRLI